MHPSTLARVVVRRGEVGIAWVFVGGIDVWQGLRWPFVSGFEVGHAFGRVPFKWPSKHGGMRRDMGWWWRVRGVLV